MDKVDAAAQELRRALDGKEVASIREKNETLKRVLQEVGASVYQQAQKQGAPPGDQGQSGNVSDADYKVADDK